MVVGLVYTIARCSCLFGTIQMLFGDVCSEELDRLGILFAPDEQVTRGCLA